MVRYRLFTATSAVSLMLCVATVWLWVRSHHACADQIGWGRERQAGGDYVAWGVQSEAGLLIFSVMDVPRRSGGAYAGRYWHEMFLQPGRRMPPAFTTTVRGGPATGLVLPHWAVAITTGLPVAVWLAGAYRRRVSRSRSSRGLCPSCGYDLRATRERCPECGAVPAGPGTGVSVP